MKNVKHTVQYLERLYRERISEIYPDYEAESIMYMIFEKISGLSKTDLISLRDKVLSKENVSKLKNALAELMNHKPVQYVLGECDFLNIKLKVDARALIPRPETEELVQWVIQNVKDAANGFKKPVNIIDIGTGSGCVAIAIKKEIPDAQVFAIDIDNGALELSRQNAAGNHVEVNFFHADILNKTKVFTDARFDIIVSNPPYVTLSDKNKMEKNVICHEPGIALFVPGEDPLIYYRAIVNFAIENLIENGMIFFEINERFGEKIKELLSGDFYNIKLKKDFRGKDRMIKAVIG